MPDVTILLEHDGRLIELTAISLAQAKQRLAVAWPKLFEPGTEQEAAAFEVIMTDLAESLGARH